MGRRTDRDVAKDCERAEFAARLRRLADAIEKDGRFEIRVAGERVYIPADARFSIEHERSDGAEEVEFQLRWKRRA